VRRRRAKGLRQEAVRVGPSEARREVLLWVPRWGRLAVMLEKARRWVLLAAVW
jgi:hypothetical protein